MTHRRAVAPTRRQATLALTTLAALSLTACGIGEDEDTGAASQESAPEDSGSEQSGASDGGGRDQQQEAADQSPDSGEVIDPNDAVDAVTYTLPTDTVDGTMTVGLHHLRVRGNTMELLLTYTPEFTQNETYTLWALHGGSHGNVPPALFDRTNLKRYDILRSGGTWDSADVWNSKQAEHELASGETQAYWANFATPEDDIETINVAIPNAPEFEDVPIDRDSSGSPGGSSDAEGGEG